MKTVCHEFSESGSGLFCDDSVFKIKSGMFELALVFLTLAGACDIASFQNNDTVVLDVNYFLSDSQKNDERSLVFLDSFQEGLALSDYEGYIKKNAHSNRKFYKPFLCEIASAVYCEQKSLHTAAFVHIYRAYEHMAYAFPMIYASKTDDYVGTFENLRKWLAGAKSDEMLESLSFINLLCGHCLMVSQKFLVLSIFILVAVMSLESLYLMLFVGRFWDGRVVVNTLLEQ